MQHLTVRVRQATQNDQFCQLMQMAPAIIYQPVLSARFGWFGPLQSAKPNLVVP